LETVTVYYRWHPLFGLVLPVWRRTQHRDGQRIYCKAPDGKICLLPEWMLRPECMQLSEGAPLVSVDALARLHQLLKDLQRRSHWDKGFLTLSGREGSHEAKSETARAAAKAAAARSATHGSSRRQARGTQLTQALMELLINAAQKTTEHANAQSRGGRSESETHA
jgi:hypothetical protein